MQNPVELRSSYLLFFPLVIFSLIVDIVRLPEVVSPFRPDIMTLVLIFFAMYDPGRFSIGWAWFCGLLLDLLTGAPLAQNALCAAMQIYLISSQFRRFALFAKWQQMIVIYIINILGHTLGYWISHIAGAVTYSANIVYPSVVTALLWPVVFYLVLFLCRAMNIKLQLPREE